MSAFSAPFFVEKLYTIKPMSPGLSAWGAKHLGSGCHSIHLPIVIESNFAAVNSCGFHIHKCSASPGGNCRVSRYDAIVPITHSFHPLPDRDRSRIASGLWVRRLPPVVVTLLLIVWVTLAEDTRHVLDQAGDQVLVLLFAIRVATFLAFFLSLNSFPT